MQHFALSALFLVMAFIQLNDPDPALWVLLYLSIAILPAACFWQRRLPIFWGVSAGIAAACLALSFAGFVDFIRFGDYASIGGDMTAEKPYVESAREFLGTLIGVSCLLGYRRWHTASGTGQTT